MLPLPMNVSVSSGLSWSLLLLPSSSAVPLLLLPLVVPTLILLPAEVVRE